MLTCKAESYTATPLLLDDSWRALGEDVNGMNWEKDTTARAVIEASPSMQI